MSFLTDMLDRARGWLGTPPPAEPTLTDAITSDVWDAEAWQNVRAAAPAVNQLTTELGERFDYASDLVRDVYLGCLQGDPQVRPAGQLKPSHQPHAPLMTELLGSPEMQTLRQSTMHDQYDAAMGLLSMAPAVETVLARTQQARDAAEAAESARQAARDARSQAMAAAQAAEAAPSVDPNATPEQQAAQQAAQDAAAQSLADALAAAQAAAEQAGQAQADASTAAGNLARGARQELREAAQAAADERDAEQQLMSAFGVEDGELQRMSFDERAELARLLKGSRLGAFAAYIGGWRAMASAERRRKVQHASSELHSIELSANFERLTPSELVNLAVPELEDEFWKRLVQGQLQTYSLRGNEKLGKGAIIVVLDTSGSMAATDMPGGVTREVWSKAFLLALLDQAKSAKRDFHAVLFSSSRQQMMFSFPLGRGPVADVVAMIECFYNGGTNFERPLTMATEVIDRDYLDAGRSKADVVFITDDAGAVAPEFLAEWQRVKKLTDFRCFGVAVGTDSSGCLEAVSDNVRQVTALSGGDPLAMADVFRTV